jgi:sugar/nucleoside kinase (ribokinase family)
MSDDATPTVWVVGDVAWDTVAYLDALPPLGTFARAVRRVDRPGGSAANVAQALATTGTKVGFVTQLGKDELGRKMFEELTGSDISDLHIAWTDEPTQHLVVLIDARGERTLISLAGGGKALSLTSVPLKARDMVVFVAWEPAYLDALGTARKAGCTTVVGLSAVHDDAVIGADLAVGSRSELVEDFDAHGLLDRFTEVVITNGSEGATHFGPGGATHQSAYPTDVVDTTGAGDAFLSGFLAIRAAGGSTSDALDSGARWAAATVRVEASIPPAWGDVAHRTP